MTALAEPSISWRGVAALLITFAAGLFTACGESPQAATRTRWLVVGLDGGEWKVIERRWAEGGMPNLRALADRGSRAVLRSDYAKSPVIWTTLATGMKPAAHGISDFVVPTASGDVPVSSDQRRVPALWNMLTAAKRRVGVVGWWASWPAEEVSGVIVSDRLTVPRLERRVYPDSELERMEGLLAAHGDSFPDLLAGAGSRRDSAHTAIGAALLAEADPEKRLDLTMVYLRTPDLASHPYWRFFETEAFPALPAEELAADSHRIPEVYEAVDRAIGTLVAAAGPLTNVMVLSDHGFRAAADDTIKNYWNLDALLVALGLQQRAPGPSGGIDLASSRLYTYGSGDLQMAKKVRCALAGRDPGGKLDAAGCAAARQELAAALPRFTDADGQPLLAIRETRGYERRDGADFMVRMRRTATPTALLDGQPLAGVLLGVERLSGEHRADTHGVLVVAGPDIAKDAALEGISIFDVTPTLLFGLGLPIGEDFAGRAWQEMFVEGFVLRSPLRRVKSWGSREAAAAKAAPGDDEAMAELRALGYIQ